MLPAPIPDNELERIESLRRMLLLSSPDEEAFDRVTRTVKRMFSVPIALVSLIDSQRQWFKSCIGLPIRETAREISFCGHAIAHNQLLVVENAAADPRFSDNPLATGEPHVIFYAGRPLYNAEGYAVGTLCMIDHHPRTFTVEDRRSLDDLGYWVENIFATRELSQTQQALLAELDEARRSSMLDPMLNIWNRAAAMMMLERESLRAFRSHSPLSIMMIDVDHFKQINDEFGHPGGDAVLIEIAKRMLGTTRTYDTLGRWGGDEFMVVLPDASPEKAAEIAQRLLRSVEYPFLLDEKIVEFSISIGISTADFITETPEANEHLARAEQALLTAKRQGKNRFEVFKA